MSKVVINLAIPRSIWSPPSSLIGRVQTAFGKGWNVVNVPSSPDGTERSAREIEVTRAADGAEVYFGWGISDRVVTAASGTLRWVHVAAAGVGSSISPGLLASGAVLTNSREIHAEPIADWVVAALGFCARGFHQAAAAQRDGVWANRFLTASDTPLMEFADIRVGLVGLGGIGRAVARRCAALGIEVRAVRRHRSRERPKEVLWVGGQNELLDLAADSNVLVLALPYTRETKGIVDDAVLRALPRGAFVLNVSRGALLDETTLVNHLDSGHLGGCILDVFEKEPLPQEHRFWAHPKVFMTPHISAVSHRFWERESSLFVENIRRYLQREPLRNVVNLEAGY